MVAVEAMAGIDKTGIESVEHRCYKFTEKRMRTGHQHAEGKALTAPDKRTFERIMATRTDQMTPRSARRSSATSSQKRTSGPES